LSRLNDGGRIVNVSSSGTRFADPSHFAYYMTKGAINNLTLTLAQQLGKRGITVNSLAPGVTDTRINAAWLNDDAHATLAARQCLGALGCRKILPGLRFFLPLTTAAGSQDSSSKRAADYGYDATGVAAPELKVFLQKRPRWSSENSTRESGGQ